jgi:hypothetical protein
MVNWPIICFHSKISVFLNFFPKSGGAKNTIYSDNYNELTGATFGLGLFGSHKGGATMLEPS